MQVVAALERHQQDLRDGLTPMHWAARAGRAEAVARLAEAGAELNAATAADQTPLHLAASEGHTEAVEALAQAGADLSNPDTNGQTPMRLAQERGHAQVVSALRRHLQDLRAAALAALADDEAPLLH